MIAIACLPEEFGGHLELTLEVVYDSLASYAAAGCSVHNAESFLQKGNDALTEGSFVRACNWYQKAYGVVAVNCP